MTNLSSRPAGQNRFASYSPSGRGRISHCHQTVRAKQPSSVHNSRGLLLERKNCCAAARPILRNQIPGNWAIHAGGNFLFRKSFPCPVFRDRPLSPARSPCRNAQADLRKLVRTPFAKFGGHSKSRQPIHAASESAETRVA